MTYRIVQYIQPWEIDDLERQINCMILSSYYLSKPKDVIWNVNMNTSCVDWDNSKLPLSFFTKKFKYLSDLVDAYFVSEFTTDDSIGGCSDMRRQTAKKTQDFIIWLDSDLYFSRLTLPYMINAAKSLIESHDHSQKDFIISPQLIRYWDSSWDCLVNEAFLNEPHNQRDYFDLYSLDIFVEIQQLSLKENNQIKFGGGWFNLFTSNLLNKITIPDELGSYGPDDTYVAVCSSLLGVKQHILNGVVVSEVGNKYLTEEKKSYIKESLSILINDKEKITDQQLHQLISNFYNNIRK